MKTLKTLKLIFMVLTFSLFTNCSTDDSDDPNNNPPGLFSANSTDVTVNTASIVWTESIDVDEDGVTYSIYLEDELIVSGLSGLSYTLTGLEPETSYDGYVEANDGRGGTSIADFAVLTEPEVLVFNITDDIDWIFDSFPEGEGIREIWRTGFEIPFYDNASQYQLEIIDYRYGFNDDEPCPCIGNIYTWTNDEPHDQIHFVGESQRFALQGTTVNTTNPEYDNAIAALESYYGEVQVIITLDSN